MADRPAVEDPVQQRLQAAIPAPRSELRHDDAWQLLVATILSAQSTDRTVNAVTLELFRRWPTPGALADATQEEVEEVVRRTGFFRNKAKAIRQTAAAIRDRHHSEVPRTLEALTALPGVARKTANVVLGTAFGVASGIVVDTHARRVAQRLGLTTEDKPERVERDLCARFPQDAWIGLGHRLVLHGRYVCVARRPACAICPLNELCPSSEAPPEGTVEARAAAEAQRVEEGLTRSGA